MAVMLSYDVPRSHIPSPEGLVGARSGEEMRRGCGVRVERGNSVLCNIKTICLQEKMALTKCSNVLRSLIVARSHTQTLPSVPAVTATSMPAYSTHATPSMLSPSWWPSKLPTMSPLLSEMTLAPPFAPPTTASVLDALMARDVIPPSRANRTSADVNLSSGVSDVGVVNKRKSDPVRIFLPVRGSVSNRMGPGKGRNHHRLV